MWESELQLQTMRKLQMHYKIMQINQLLHDTKKVHKHTTNAIIHT